MKRIVTFLLLVTMILSSRIPNYAAFNNDHYLSFTTENFGVGMSSRTLDSSVSLEKAQIVGNDEMTIKGNLAYKGEVIPVIITGKLYLHEDGYQNGNLILGDMRINNKNFEVVNFKMFGRTEENYLHSNNQKYNGNSSITMVLKNLNDSSYVSLQSILNKSVFDKYRFSSKDATTELKMSSKEYKKDLMKLYQLNDSAQEKAQSFSYKSDNISESSSYATQSAHAKLSAISYSGLSALFNELESKGYAYLKDYDVPSSLFTTTGWKHYNPWGSTPYFYTKYSKDNGLGKYLMQIAFCDIITSNQNISNDKYETSLQMNYNNGMQLSYDKNTDRVEVLYYNWGCDVKKIELAISKLRGHEDHIFYKRDINGKLRSSTNTVKGLVGLTPAGKFMLDVWSIFSGYEQTNAIGNVYYFGDTVDEQTHRYDGNVVRGVFANSGSASINSKGDYLGLIGNFMIVDVAEWDWSYKYVAYSDL